MAKLRKSRPQLLALLQRMKGSSLPELFKRSSLDVELLTELLDALAAGSGSGAALQEPAEQEWALSFLEGLLQAQGFELAASMLLPEDQQKARTLLLALAGSADAARLGALQGGFGCR